MAVTALTMRDIDTKRIRVSDPKFPVQEPGRLKYQIGVPLPQKVITNHFRVNLNALPAIIDQCHVHIYQWKKDENAFETTDLSMTINRHFGFTLLKEFMKICPGMNNLTAYLYDGRTILYMPADARRTGNTFEAVVEMDGGKVISYFHQI